MGESYDVVRGVNSGMALVAPNAVTKTLVVPAGLVNDAVVGAAFTLPEANGYYFDLSGSGTIDDAGHTAKLDMVVQGLMLDGATWVDLVLAVEANRTARRMFLGFAAQLDRSPGLQVGGQIHTNSSGGVLLKNSAQSTNAVSVTSPLANDQVGTIFPHYRTFRLVGTGRTASPTVGDTITLKVSAVVNPEQGV